MAGLEDFVKQLDDLRLYELHVIMNRQENKDRINKLQASIDKVTHGAFGMRPPLPKRPMPTYEPGDYKSLENHGIIPKMKHGLEDIKKGCDLDGHKGH